MVIVLKRLLVAFDIPQEISRKERLSSQAVHDCCADWPLAFGILRLHYG